MNKWKYALILSLVTGFAFVCGAPTGFAQTKAAPQAKAKSTEATSAQPPAESAPAPAETVVTEEILGEVVLGDQAAAIAQAADKLIKEEIEAVGSFEVDHPETGDLLSLSLVKVGEKVTQPDEGEYLIQADFKDQAGTSYVVDVYLEEIGSGQYEIADAIIESVAGKTVSDNI